MVTTLFLLFACLLALAAPIFVVLSLSTLGAFWFHSAIPLQTIVQRLFAGLDKFALMAIPFFISAANVMSGPGMSRCIIAAANVLVGPLPGGLAMATVVACMFFGAISGSSPATVVAMGGILYDLGKDAKLTPSTGWMEGIGRLCTNRNTAMPLLPA